MVLQSKPSGRGRGRGRGRGGGRGSAKTEEPTACVANGENHETDEEAIAAPEASDAGFQKWEERLWAEGFPVVAGTDEAGRGPLAGPVVAAAFAVLDHDDKEVRELLQSVADSKQMKAADRESVYAQLTDEKFKGRTVWAVGEASSSEIDETNILSAALTCMAQSVQRLDVRPDCVLVDGCNRPPELLKPGETWTRGTKEERSRAEAVKQVPKLSRWFTPKKEPAPPSKQEEEKAEWRPRLVEAVIHGDGLVPSISAASVIAKVHRDHLMSKLHEKYPLYGFASHQGYGTADHMEALKAHGPCPEHRRSFRPVREALGLEEADGNAVAGQQTLSSLMGSREPASGTGEAPNVQVKADSCAKVSEKEEALTATPPTRKEQRSGTGKTGRKRKEAEKNKEDHAGAATAQVKISSAEKKARPMDAVQAGA